MNPWEEHWEPTSGNISSEFFEVFANNLSFVDATQLLQILKTQAKHLLTGETLLNLGKNTSPQSQIESLLLLVQQKTSLSERRIFHFTITDLILALSKLKASAQTEVTNESCKEIRSLLILQKLSRLAENLVFFREHRN